MPLRSAGGFILEGDWTPTKTKLSQLTTYRGGSLIFFQDERDPAVKEKADQRQSGFVDENNISSDITFEKLVKASNTLGADLFVMGGDIIYSDMYASIECVEENLQKLDAPFCTV